MNKTSEDLSSQNASLLDENALLRLHLRQAHEEIELASIASVSMIQEAAELRCLCNKLGGEVDLLRLRSKLSLRMLKRQFYSCTRLLVVLDRLANR